MNLLETVEQDTMPTHYKQMTQVEMIARVTEIKAQLGENLFIPCHHYQKDEVVPFADAIGDSLQLAQIAAQNKKPNISFLRCSFYGRNSGYAYDKRADCYFARYARWLFDGRYGGHSSANKCLAKTANPFRRYDFTCHLH